MRTQPVLAGLVLAVVGFASSFAVVLAGLRAAGASQAQAASGLLALSVAMGLTAVWLSLRHRMPISVVWSTPGAALLASVGGHSFQAAVGAFLVTGLLLVVTGLSATLTRALRAIPTPVASAMLAGVLVPLCLAPVQAVVRYPAEATPTVLVWLVLTRFARRWAVPGALLAALPGILGHSPSYEGPALVFTTPTLSAGAVVGIAVPLFIVTMAAQNVPGLAMLKSYGYEPPLRPLLTGTGAATVLVAPFGGHAVNLAAITAALAAGPDAGPDRSRRWIASVTGGIAAVALGLSAGLAAGLIESAPPLLIEAVAGLALLGTLGSALQATVGDEAAIITFVVTVSGIAPLGIGAPFWGLLAGLAFRIAMRRPRPADLDAADEPSPIRGPDADPPVRTLTPSE